MKEEGKYIYGIIGTNEARDFGAMGVGSRDDTVSTVSHQGVSAVISNFPMGSYDLTRQNLMAHQIVVERVMRDHTVLPMRAFTVASSAEEVRDFLRKNYRELTGLLKDMDNKVELGLAGSWRDMPAIFREIASEDREVSKSKDEMTAAGGPQTLEQRVALGQKVASALEARKEREREEILRPLRRIAVTVRNNDVHGDPMVFNSAFLVDRSREKEFDGCVDELDKEYGQRMRFRYIGPVPPYNFVDLRV